MRPLFAAPAVPAKGSSATSGASAGRF